VVRVIRELQQDELLIRRKIDVLQDIAHEFDAHSDTLSSGRLAASEVLPVTCFL
jgi:hypothetical protein